jgi:hypothetical protein
VPDDAGFWLLVLGVGAAGGLWAGYRALHLSRLLQDTPTSRIRSAAQGYVELAGRSEPLVGTENLAPLTLRPCVWWSYRIEQRTGSASGSPGRARAKWRVVQSGSSGQPFLLDDGTGQCLVNPQGAQVLATESTSWWGDTPWPAGPPGSGARAGFGSEREYRYTERRIYAHERVVALGEFRSLDAVGESTAEEQVADLLREWKQDQVALAQRFDRDGDGEVGLAEWEAAHAQARREVAQRRSERPASSALLVLARPRDGRTFLLSAIAEADLVRRYRRRAALGFGLVFGAAIALGWLFR